MKRDAVKDADIFTAFFWFDAVKQDYIVLNIKIINYIKESL